MLHFIEQREEDLVRRTAAHELEVAEAKAAVPFFPGFYETYLSLKYVASDGEIVVDNLGAEKYLAQCFAGAFQAALNSEIRGIRIVPTMIDSPSDYSRGQDVLLAQVFATEQAIVRAEQYVDARSYSWAEHVKERHASYDGFVSWVDNDATHPLWNVRSIMTGKSQDRHGWGRYQTLLAFLASETDFATDEESRRYAALPDDGLTEFSATRILSWEGQRYGWFDDWGFEYVLQDALGDGRAIKPNQVEIIDGNQSEDTGRCGVIFSLRGYFDSPLYLALIDAYALECKMLVKTKQGRSDVPERAAEALADAMNGWANLYPILGEGGTKAENEFFAKWQPALEADDIQAPVNDPAQMRLF